MERKIVECGCAMGKSEILGQNGRTNGTDRLEQILDRQPTVEGAVIKWVRYGPISKLKFG